MSVDRDEFAFAGLPFIVIGLGDAFPPKLGDNLELTLEISLA